MVDLAKILKENGADISPTPYVIQYNKRDLPADSGEDERRFRAS